MRIEPNPAEGFIFENKVVGGSIPTDYIPAVKKGIEKMEGKEEEMISIDDFSKIKLKVATVLKVEKVPKSSKLLRLEVNDGEGIRQIVAGISQHYEPEKLEGKQVVIVANLKPVKLMGIESNGMLLAASDGETLAVLTPEACIKNGSKVR